MISAAVAEQWQKQVQNEVDRSSARFDAAGDQVVDTEMPLEGQEVGVLRGQVVAEQVEDRRQREQREKADLRQRRDSAAAPAGSFEWRADQREAPDLARPSP